MVEEQVKELPVEQPQVEENNPPKREPLSRREFLQVLGIKLAAVMLGTTAAGASVKKAYDWVSGEPSGGEKESFRLSINLAEFTSPVEQGDPSVVAIDFIRLKKYYPFLLDNREGNYVFVNRENDGKFVELSLDDLDGKKVVFPQPNVFSAAKSNVPPEQYGSQQGYDKLKAGLVFEGNFAVGFDRKFAEKPLLSGEGLDRIIAFKDREGGSSVSKVKNVRLEGLNDCTQHDGAQDIPAPAYISADNTLLSVEGVEINHTPRKPEAMDEVNSQLARGIISHNTTGRENKIHIADTSIKGLLWDAVNANGSTEMVIKNSTFKQSEEYRHRRGAGVSITFDNNTSVVDIEGSKIDYNKGISTFIDDHEPSTYNDIRISRSIISTSQWSIMLKDRQRARLERCEIDASNETSEVIWKENPETWDDVPIGHLNVEFSKPEVEKSMEDIFFRVSPFAPDEDKVVLMKAFGGMYSIQNPEEYIERFSDRFGKIGMIDAKAMGAPTYFTSAKMKAVLTRAMQETGNCPWTIAVIYRRGDPTIFDQWGVVVDKYDGWLGHTPSKIFWYQPLEEQRGYQDNPRY